MARSTASIFSVRMSDMRTIDWTRCVARGILLAMKPLDELTDGDLRACVISSDYPLVECSHGGPSLPGYLVCVHAIAQSLEMVVERADPAKVGKATCRACVRSTRLRELRTACAHFVRDRFAVPL
jgi:hypothetical protein